MPITFSKLGSLGRLGNQLFQIAATKGIACRNGATAQFPQWKYVDYFEEPMTVGPPSMNVHKEQQYHHYDIIGKDMDLHGYFQSARYFPPDYKPTFKRKYLDVVRQKMKPDRKTIGVHIRRGDYVGHPEYYQLPVTWFIQALVSIPDWQEHDIYFVSDDLNYCKVHFECLTNAIFLPGNEIEHLMLLSLCDRHILSNSSFSWWGGYLSNDPKPIHSGKLFRGSYEATKSIQDFYPTDWQEFWPEEERLDLSDVTFTIPVYYDHPDRKKNLDLSLCLLQKTVKAEYIICEQGGDKFKYTEQWATYMQDTSNVFHRTKMLNDMAKAARTPIIVNWDADIFIPPMQLWLMAEANRKGTPAVYPYDGRFARMDRLPWFQRIEQALDIGISGGITWKGKGGRPMAETSVGGAVSWLRDDFFELGMENERFISFGPEDVERYERVKKLGVEPVRIGGCLYHMNHFVGPDSSKANPFFQNNHKELEKIRVMVKGQLREYIDSWPWRSQYTPKYYHSIQEGAIRSAKEVYDFLSSVCVEPKSVIDIGCGVGEWFQEGQHYVGVDYGAPEQGLLFDLRNYVNCNLEKEFPSGFSRFDLCVCLEVAEHVSAKRADALIKSLCSYSDKVLFSAAIPHQGGQGHINEQWQTYWAQKFEANGFYPRYVYPMRNNHKVEPWYRQNMVLYVKGESQPRKVVYDFILPDYYMEIVKHLKAG